MIRCLFRELQIHPENLSDNRWKILPIVREHTEYHMKQLLEDIGQPLGGQWIDCISSHVHTSRLVV
jgi:hypothetical protein